jgi:hypothetical protein
MRYLITLAVASGLVLQASGACALQAPRVNRSAQVLEDFRSRVDKYLEITKTADNGLAPLRQTSDPAKIKVAQQSLQQRIIAARPGARHGDIFTPEIIARFRSLLRPEVGDKATKELIADDNPGNVPYKVMAPYPDNEPLSTVPANVLAALPELPKEIEYRFVGKHLILRDARADLIIDYIANIVA